MTGIFPITRSPMQSLMSRSIPPVYILWKRCYPGNDSTLSMTEKRPPMMIMVGQSYTDPAIPDYHGGYDVLVVKSDMNGTIVWGKALGDRAMISGTIFSLLRTADISASGTRIPKTGTSAGTTGHTTPGCSGLMKEGRLSSLREVSMPSWDPQTPKTGTSAGTMDRSTTGG